MMTNTSFLVVETASSSRKIAKNCGVLTRDSWDDWGKYETQFYLSFFDADGVNREIGSLKIGQLGLKPARGVVAVAGESRMPGLPTTFSQLDGDFFSLGQSDEYYERLNALGSTVRDAILLSLRDVAKDQELWDSSLQQEVMQESLLRFVTVATVEGQFRRMANGGAKLTNYSFVYIPPSRVGSSSGLPRLTFQVMPDSQPPTNVHILIGRNGVGKTRLLSLMAKSLIAPKNVAAQSGKFEWNQVGSGGARAANLVCVSFSAFDDADNMLIDARQENNFPYSYVGLKKKSNDAEGTQRPKSPRVLATEFTKSLAACQERNRKRRWISAVQILSSDPVFGAADIGDLISSDLRISENEEVCREIFGKLSSGHKVVLLTITKLVEVVEEKTLVLMDEPEAYLHPPLLSAFVRAVSELLLDRNGVAIISTHSPVVLQEAPKSCVWILNRIGADLTALRPDMETFGENVGILTREVFKLEVSKAGFHKILEDSATKYSTFDSAVESFNGQLGAEARGVLMAIFLSKNARSER
jgi:hypothetical protein